MFFDIMIIILIPIVINYLYNKNMGESNDKPNKSKVKTSDDFEAILNMSWEYKGVN